MSAGDNVPPFLLLTIMVLYLSHCILVVAEDLVYSEEYPNVAIWTSDKQSRKSFQERGTFKETKRDVKVTEQNMSRNYQNTHTNITAPMIKPRIIGGQEVVKGRYPFIVSLIQQNKHVCGGSLIADDIILTAAHCTENLVAVQVGRHHIINEKESYQSFVIEKFITHPGWNTNEGMGIGIGGLYDEGTAGASMDNDFMIIKIYGWTNNNPVRVNKDSNVPAKENDELTVMGWGVTNEATGAFSSILKEVTVNYMTNKKCEQAEGFADGSVFSIKDEITSNMLCAKDLNEDACQGDSGGPLLIVGNSAENDLQVGVVSWGIGCGHSIFPGIYSRISQQYDWIKAQVCSLAEEPPKWFDCEIKVVSETQKKQSITVDILLDTFPKETAWLIKSDKKTYAHIPIGSYGDDKKNKRVISTVNIPIKTKCYFVMIDLFGDGLKYKGGNYKVWVGGKPNVGLPIITGAKYGYSIAHMFSLSEAPSNNNPNPSPNINPSPNFNPNLNPSNNINPSYPNNNLNPNYPANIDNEGLMTTEAPTVLKPSSFITIAIKLDNHPEESSWTLETDSNELIMSRDSGFYAGKNHALITETVHIFGTTNSLSKYIFTIRDTNRNGICCDFGPGFFKGYLGRIRDNRVIIQGKDFNRLQKIHFEIDWVNVIP